MTDIRSEVAAALRDTMSCTDRCDHEGVEWVWISVDAHADELLSRFADRGLTVVREEPLPVPPYHDDRGDLQEAWQRGYLAARGLTVVREEDCHCAERNVTHGRGCPCGNLARQPEGQP